MNAAIPVVKDTSLIPTFNEYGTDAAKLCLDQTILKKMHVVVGKIQDSLADCTVKISDKQVPTCLNGKVITIFAPRPEKDSIAAKARDANTQAPIVKVYSDALQMASDQGMKSIAFPSVRSGRNGFDPEIVNRVAFLTIYRFMKQNPDAIDRVEIVLTEERYAKNTRDHIGYIFMNTSIFDFGQ